ncbi:DUF2189 domain-containing protein [Jannaschia donghaensis]|uniref:Putative integral membrane protein n=1 Tax=Jannaschia donghaensis TaxID=420998 RepID=A0A0M6YGX9_9RHOB|nr:DUF2189 domain-containing protein [Jannaschia donghaensis]CTQ49602.1 putative integral membrane protein [Jannaschia donghaensis]
MADIRTRSGDLRPATLHLSDLGDALRAGWADFRAAPRFGLFFAGIYVVAGLLLIQLGAGFFTWTLTLTLGFPLIAPFLAVGLYDVSRRRHAGLPLRFGDVLSVIWRERDRQIPWAGAVMLIYLMFWSFVAHMLFALVMGPQALLGPPDTLASYLDATGVTLLVVETVFGAACAFLLFALTAVSLPLLLDRDVDFVTAMKASLAVTRANPRVMSIWGITIAGLTFLAMIPALLGLFVVLPVLGHASWHLYRRALR